MVPVTERMGAQDRGSGTVHVLTLAMVLGVLLLAVLLLAQAGIAAHRAGKAADLAALAAADTARGLVAGDPCGAAERVARDNGARLERCALVEPERVVVEDFTPLVQFDSFDRFRAALETLVGTLREAGVTLR